jgi:hypothetical protein
MAVGANDLRQTGLCALDTRASILGVGIQKVGVGEAPGR